MGIAALLFTSDPAQARAAAEGGAEAAVVDLESLGKAERQRGAGTDISGHTLADVRRVRDAGVAVVCRIDGPHAGTPAQIDAVLAAGAGEILVPMVRTAAEVRAVLDHVAGRARVGIMVETPEAVEAAPELARLAIARAYVGLNDLSLARRSQNLFAPVIDGTVERLRRCFDVPFGFGGLTLPELGHPIPARLLLGEMVRLGCGFGFLRRSFARDAAGIGCAEGVRRIRAGAEACARRTPAEVEADRAALAAAVAGWIDR